jgi:O-antigen/teichoic acid export membrane protein
MQGKFLSTLLLSLVLNLLIKPISLFGIDAAVQNQVGATEYGLYFSLLNLSVLFNILIDLGINNYTIRTMAQDPFAATKHVGRIMVLRGLLFLVYSVFTLGVAIFIGYDGHELQLMGILIFNQLLIMFTAYARSYFSGLHYFKTDAILSVLDRFLLIFICGFVLYSSFFTAEFQIEWYIWIQTICYAITLLVALFLLSRIIHLNHFTFDRKLSATVIKQSLPYAALILLMLLYTRSDSVILERLHETGRFESGVYAQGFRLLDALYMFGMVFAGLLFPMFSRLLKQSNKEIIPLLQTSGNLLIGGCSVLIIALYFNAELVLGWIYENNVNYSAHSFRWLMLGFFGISLNFIFGTLLSANGNFKELNYLAFTAVIFNIGMNLFIAPVYGSVGISITFFITQVGVAIAQLFIAKEKIGFRFIPKFIGVHLLLIAMLVLVGLLISSSEMLFIVQLILGGILLLALRIIDIKELKLMFLPAKATKNNISA